VCRAKVRHRRRKGAGGGAGSGGEEPEGHYADSVRSSVGLRAGVDDQGVEEVCAHLTCEPVQVSGVPVVDGARELDLYGNDLAVVADEDQVDLVVAVASAQVSDSSFRGLGGDSKAQSGQRLEEVAQQASRLGSDGRSVTSQQSIDVQAEQSGGQRGIGEVVLLVKSRRSDTAAAPFPDRADLRASGRSSGRCFGVDMRPCRTHGNHGHRIG
jgi:hypothetical protein